MKNLKKAIEGPFVQRPDIANQLEKSVSSTASTAGVTKKSILFKFKCKLFPFYLRLAEIPRVWPPVASKTFINLALMKTSGEPSKSDYSVCGNADDVLAKKEMIKYEQAFGTHSDSEIILVLGRPGSGKTTLVRKVVKDWVQGLVLKGAELVYLISLRSLTSEHNKLPNILSPFHFQENTRQEVSDNIEKVDGKGVCFILDGLDEYPPQNYEKSLISALINRSYLPEAMVVVTSRPAAASTYLPNMSSFKQIEVFGFSREDIFKYINNFPYSKSSSSSVEPFPEKLKTFLESRPGLLDLCYLPVNVAILCFLYDYDPELPETQTEMYKHFTTSIIIRQLKQENPSFTLQSLEDLKGEEAEMFKNLCQLAFEMTINSRQVMSHGEFNIDNKNSLGLVTIDVSAQLSGEYQNSYSFLHMTLQEFLAAYHISKLSYGQLLEVIEKCRSIFFLMYPVWKFYFGIANFSNEEEIKKAEKIIQQESLKRDLFSILCAYEAKQYVIIKLVSAKELNILFLQHVYDLSALAYVISEAASPDNEATPTTHLQFAYNILECDLLDFLLSQLSDRAIGYLEEFSVRTGANYGSNVKPLADKLQSGTLKSLKHLTLDSLNLNTIGDDGTLTLAAGLRNHHLFTLLELQNCSIGAVGARALMLCPCPLKVLNLSYNKIGDEGARAIARKLRGSPDFQTIILSQCEISAEGVEALADATSRDMALCLARCGIGSATSEDFIISSAWRFPREHFKDKLFLNVSDNEQLACGVTDVIALLGCFKSLIALDLSQNQLGRDGAMAIADYVLHQDNCNMLEYLNLSHNNIGNGDVISIALRLLNHDRLEWVIFSPTSWSEPAIHLNSYVFDYDEVMALARGIQQMQDFNYSQIDYPVLDIDISNTVLDMEQLGVLKRCSRVRNIKFTLLMYEDRNIATESESDFVRMERAIFKKKF